MDRKKTMSVDFDKEHFLKGTRMTKALQTLIVLCFCLADSWAQKNPDLIISVAGNSHRSLYYFDQIEKVGDDYSAVWEIQFEDSVIADTLYFSFLTVKEILIKRVAFLRGGVEYFSEDSFPSSDSIKWKLKENLPDDTIQLQDSLIIIKCYHNEVMWLLDKEYAFHRGDMLEFLMDTYPIMDVSQVRPNRNKQISVQKNCKMFISTGRWTEPMLSGKERHLKVFTISGKKQSGIMSKSGIFIVNKKGDRRP